VKPKYPELSTASMNDGRELPLYMALTVASAMGFPSGSVTVPEIEAFLRGSVTSNVCVSSAVITTGAPVSKVAALPTRMAKPGAKARTFDVPGPRPEIV
jgi:hypothetical protein